MSKRLVLACLCGLLLLSFPLRAATECEPVIFYPELKALQLLSSSETQVLITVHNEDSTSFCVLYDTIESTFSDQVTCNDYVADVFESESADATETRINGISEELGIDITRNSRSFVIPWSDIPSPDGPQSVGTDDLTWFTLNSEADEEYMTFVRLASNDLVVIKFDLLDENTYDVYQVGSSHMFRDSSNAVGYDEYQMIVLEESVNACKRKLLFDYTLIEYTTETNFVYYYMNMTEIVSEENIIVDSRSDMLYMFGYSPIFYVFDVPADRLNLQIYNFEEIQEEVMGKTSIGCMWGVQFALLWLCSVTVVIS